MIKGKMLYEGKAKRVFETDHDELYIVEYKDDATAFNGQKKGTISGKGVINNRVSNHLMQLLEEHGIPTHYVQELSEIETAVKRVAIVPIEVIIRNVVAGSLAQRLGLIEGMHLRMPIIEYCYKNDDLGDPMINEHHAAALGFATPEEMQVMNAYSFRINEILSAHLKEAGVELVDFKLEYGRLPDGTIILADEISPDTCRFWDAKTGEKLDKDRFRRDLGGVEDAYKEIRRRLLG